MDDHPEGGSHSGEGFKMLVDSPEHIIDNDWYRKRSTGAVKPNPDEEECTVDDLER